MITNVPPVPDYNNEEVSAPNSCLNFVLVAGWGLALLLGFYILINHQITAGVNATKPGHWPEKSKLARAANNKTVVVFAHPYCPCTRATLNELNRLYSKCVTKPAVDIAFWKPADRLSSWVEDSENWRMAHQLLPWARISIDRDNFESRIFKASTSGLCLIYSKTGILLFSGGITAGRGHEGDNAAEDEALAAINADRCLSGPEEVYGCSLVTPQ